MVLLFGRWTCEGRGYRSGRVKLEVRFLHGRQQIDNSQQLSAKHDLAVAALDAESNVDQVDLAGGIEELRRRLQVLLGARPEAPSDESLRRETNSKSPNLPQIAISAANGAPMTEKTRCGLSFLLRV
jgi:hypothetical protein